MPPSTSESANMFTWPHKGCQANANANADNMLVTAHVSRETVQATTTHVHNHSISPSPCTLHPPMSLHGPAGGASATCKCKMNLSQSICDLHVAFSHVCKATLHFVPLHPGTHQFLGLPWHQLSSFSACHGTSSAASRPGIGCKAYCMLCTCMTSLNHTQISKGGKRHPVRLY